MFIYEAQGLAFGQGGGGGGSHRRVSVFQEQFFLYWSFTARPKSTSERFLTLTVDLRLIVSG